MSESIYKSARIAARALNRISAQKINELLMTLADAVESNISKILESNALDLARMSENDPKYDRLKLTEGRLHDIASDMRSVASLPSDW